MNAPQKNQTQDDGRRSRFAFDHHSALQGFRDSSLPAALRDRAASQPPQQQDSLAHSSQRRLDSIFGAPGTPLSSTTAAPWSPSRHASFHMSQPPISPSSSSPAVGRFPPRASPIRSLSFSTSSDLPSRFHPFARDAFPSTFEDDEDDYDGMTDISGIGQDTQGSSAAVYGHAGLHGHSYSMSGYNDQSAPLRGTRAAALAAADNSSRSRSQSLAATHRRQLPSGSVPSWSNPTLQGQTGLQNWNEQGTNILSASTSAQRYLAGSRAVPTGGRATGVTDLSNMSPFVRHLDQILMDDGSPKVDQWANAAPLGSYSGNDPGGSGTTSRRHSVSVVQPRTRRSSAVAGFSGPGTLGTAVEDDPSLGSGRPVDRRLGSGMGGAAGLWEVSGSNSVSGFGGSSNFGSGRFGGGSMISDDELAGDLNSLNLENNGRSSAGPQGHRGDSSVVQASSLPVYALAPHLAKQRQTMVSDGGTNGAGPSPPNFEGPIRRPSVSPSRFNGRALSRERGSPTTPILEGEPTNFDLPSQRTARLTPGAAPSPTAYRNSLAQPAQGNWVSPTRLLPTGVPQQGSPLANRIPSPTSQRHSGSLASPIAVGPNGQPSYLPPTASRDQLAYSPVTSTAQSGGFGLSRGSSSGNGVPNPNLPRPNPPNGLTQIGGVFVTPGSPLEQFQQQRLAAHAQAQGLTINPSGVVAQAPTSPTSPHASTQNPVNDLGRGVPLHRIASSTPMYIVEFKAGRTDLFFCMDPAVADTLSQGDLVIVEADRGKDLGTIIKLGITQEEVEQFQRLQLQSQNAMASAQGDDESGGMSPVRSFAKEIMPKRLYGKATSRDIESLPTKSSEEAKALQLCQNKVRSKGLPMEVVEAEYQWDRRKLTFYFVSDRRIDFRELVRELFRLYKTRIWMACLQGPTAAEA